MAGFGSGLAHALTGGLTGYQEGEQDRMAQIIKLAALKRQQQQQDEELNLRRLSTLGALAGQGLDITPNVQQSGTPIVQSDTGSVRAVKSQNPTSPEAGDQPAPAQPSADGTVIGGVGGFSVRVPSGGIQAKEVRAAQQKAQQRLEKLQTLNDQITDPKLKKTPNQLQAIANDDGLYNQYVGQATGVAMRNIDPNSEEGIAAAMRRHAMERSYDVAHPTSDQSQPSWQVIQTDEGTFERNPKTGQTRPVNYPDGTPMMPRAQRGVLKQVAENQEQLQAIDTAVGLVQKHPGAIGAKRIFLPDAVSQRTDPGGVDTRAAIANVGSMLIHDRSGAAVTVSESKRLAPFVPSANDTPEAAVKKLNQLRALIAGETQALQSGSVGGAPKPAAPSGTDVSHLISKYGLEP